MKDMRVFALLATIVAVCAVWYGVSVRSGGVGGGATAHTLAAPSRAPYEDCEWEKVSGAGLELWGQRCDFDGRVLRVSASETLPGVFLEEMTDQGPVALQDLIQMFDLRHDDAIDELLAVLRGYEGWKDADGCAFAKDATHSTSEVNRYTLMPTGEALAAFEKLGKEEPINSTCAGYGMGNDGVQYFEIHRSNPRKALFLNIGQEIPLYDEETIFVRP